MTALEVLGGWPVPAAAAAVIGPAGVLATHGDTARVFALASVTKPLVARAAQVAVEEGGESRHPGRPARLHGPSPAGAHIGVGDAFRSGAGPPRHPPDVFELRFHRAGRERAAESGIEFGRYLTEAVCEPLGMVTTRLDGGRCRRVRGDLDGRGLGGVRG